MRKTLILMLIATLLVGAFLVSCNSDIASESSNGDKLVQVSIAGDDKGISATLTQDDADSYYWYYSATKTDSSVYRTGQTAWKAVKNGTGLKGANLGYFSTGDWKFSFYGYKTGNKESKVDGYVYYQEDISVRVTDTTYITVALKEGSLASTATVVFSSLNWKYEPENGTNYNATLDALNNQTATMHFEYKADGADSYSSGWASGTGTIISSASDATATFSIENSKLDATSLGKNYKLKYWVQIGEEPVSSVNTIDVVAYHGSTITLSVDSSGVAVTDNEEVNQVIVDDYIVAISSKSKQTAVMSSDSDTVTNTAAIDFTANVSETIEKATLVSFPAQSISTTTTTESDYKVEMEVVVYQTEAAQAKFVVATEGQSAFAGLDLSAALITTATVGDETTTNSEPIETFNKSVSVTTYIAKGLTGVNVVYTGDRNYGNNQHPSNIAYDKTTGKLTFTTTHFSEFAVSANEKVYDKTTNTGYTVDAFNAIDTDVIAGHEFILLDASVANDIDDSRDVFNAGYNWTAIHKAGDLPNTTDFAGGYGTKIEPYLIGNRSNLEKIKEKTSTFSYFKVSTEDESIDLDNWVTIDINGCFNGSGIKLTNLDSPLFGKANYQQAKTVKIGNFSINDCEIRMQTGRGAVCSNPAYNSIFHDILISGYIEGQGQVSAVVSYPGSGVTEFKNINVSADIVSLGDAGAAVFVLNPYRLLTSYGGNSNSKLVFNDCHFTGKMAATGDCKFFYVHTITVPVEYSNINDNEFGSAVNTYNRYALASQSSKITTSSIDISGIDAGHVFEIPKLVENATTCTVTVAISPNGPNESGSFTGVYLRDKNIQLSNQDKFVTTNCVKLTSASVNDTTKNSGLCDIDGNGLNEHYNIVSSAYGTTHNGGHLSVIQYDSDGKVVGFASTSLFPATQN